eukprot:XP_024449160.1 uncharacterized protein LOC7472735 [Populus trichocarpa]
MKNNVVYKCHHCSHFKQKRGTPKGLKEICPPKPTPAAKSKSAKSMLQKSANSEEGTSSKDEIIKIHETTLPAINGYFHHEQSSNSICEISVSTYITNSPATPQPSNKFSLLDAKKRKRNRSANKKEQSESSSAAMDAGKTVSSTLSERKRKSWTTLKEIVEKRTR